MQQNLSRASLLTVLSVLALSGCDTLPSATLEQTGPYQGVYTGGAVIVDPALPANVCSPQIPFAGFTVSGTEVRFGQFDGTIHSDGSIDMVSRGVWIRGRFVPNATFIGEMLVPPVNVCVYRVTLNRQ